MQFRELDGPALLNVPLITCEAIQRNTDGEVQRSGGNGRDKVVLPRRIQAHAVLDPDVGILRMAGHLAERE